jgi:hypothetical protein
MFRCARRSAAIAQRAQRNSLVSVPKSRLISSQAVLLAQAPLPIQQLTNKNKLGVYGVTAITTAAVLWFSKGFNSIGSIAPAHVVENAVADTREGKPGEEALTKVPHCTSVAHADCYHESNAQPSAAA